MADASFNVQVILDIVNKNLNKTVKATSNSVGRMVVPLKRANSITDAINKSFSIVNKKAKTYDYLIKKTTLNLSKQVDDMNKVNFQFLSMIFGGMALQRIFGGIFKNLHESYTKVADDNDLFIKKTNQLSGAFQFLGFSIFKGFANNEFVQSVISTLTTALIQLGDFFEEHPNLSTTIVTLTGALAGLGAVMFMSGTAISIGQGLAGLLGFKSLKALMIGLGASDFMVNMITSTGVMAIGIEIVFSLVKNFLPDDVLKEQNLGDKLLGFLGTALIVGGLKIGKVSPVTGGVLIALGVGIKLTSLLDTKDKGILQEEDVKKAGSGIIDTIKGISTMFKTDGLDGTKQLTDGMENLTSSIHNVIFKSTDYSTFTMDTTVPTMDTEKNKVDSLTTSYEKLASAKKKAKLAVQYPSVNDSFLNEQTITTLQTN